MITDQIVREIIKQQSLIVGERLAKERAADSGVVKFNSSNIDDLVVTEQNNDLIIKKLINSYEALFGKASEDVCIGILRKFPVEQVSPFLSPDLRASLQA